MSATNDKHEPSEPATPMWLPAVGALLFLGVGLLWALRAPATEMKPGLGQRPASGARDAAPLRAAPRGH